MSAKKVDGLSAPAIRRDPYKVLSVPKDANDQEINSAYRNLSLNNLGVPIKTSVNANVLEEARNGNFTLKPLPIGTSVSGKVDKQHADFFRVTISEEQAKSGVVVRVTSTEQSKFKLLYFEQDSNGGYGLALQSTSYTIEALCAKTYEDTIEKLKEIEAQVLTKRFDLPQFETEYQQLEIEYHKALARFEKGTKRYSQEMQYVDELLKQRDSIRSSFSVVKTPSGNNLSNGSSSKAQGEESKGEGDSVVEEGEPESKNRSKNKWFNFNLDGYENKKLD
ncbi:hypothetical protein ARALYDRAFT_894601 [Arabidopsis lyrata subsp. lyrata]|uniref:Uncharacterized protein n=1 Tax=Arabidopsis lyrata subsp. lyrata TaxID=81972 RepID=D7KWB2_ARALL|nr:hypothetical protein ARALYDRAFT_894601 [Arabidopsis lyrata subsp. lyrata]